MIMRPSIVLRSLIHASLCALGLACCTGIASGADTTAPANTNAPGISNRWLLVVETSQATESRQEAIRQIAAGLVASGMNGQMHRGDTLGLWTFNDQLRAGEFPLQDLAPETARTTAERVLSFLKAKKFESGSRFDLVLPELDRVAQNSEFISVILISAGAPVSGTPFDSQINTSFREWKAELDKAQMPFVTLLRAKFGKFTEYAVNTPPYPLELPRLPEELLKARERAARVVETPKPQPAPRITVPPLILSGRKPAITNAEPAPPALAPADSQPVSTPPTNAAPEVPAPAASGQSSNAAAIPETIPKVLANVATTTGARDQLPVGLGDAVASPSVPKTKENLEPVSKLESVAPGSSALELPPASTAVVTANSPRPGPSPWIVAAGVAAGLVILTAILMRRRQQAPQASLITRSLDRDHR